MTSVSSQFSIAAAACAVSLTLTAATPSGASDLRVVEFPTETAALVAATAAYFDTIEENPRSRERAPVIRLPELEQRTKSEAPKRETQVLKRNGPVDHLIGYRISWYPVERFLGSVDFMGTWDGNRNLVCGYLTWDLSQPDRPILESVAANFVNLDDILGQSPAEIHEALLEANCAFGAIDENYAFFEPAG